MVGFDAAVGKRVKMMRKRAGMNQQALADAIGLQRTSVANIEAGRQAISLRTAYVLWHLLGLGLFYDADLRYAAVGPAALEVRFRLDGAGL